MSRKGNCWDNAPMENWFYILKTELVHHTGGQKVIIALHGSDSWAPAKPTPDETLIRALARAHRWKRMLDEGRYRSAPEIAEAEGVTRSFVNRHKLLLLSDDLVLDALIDI
jgi:transposase InsO family protein